MTTIISRIRGDPTNLFSSGSNTIQLVPTEGRMYVHVLTIYTFNSTFLVLASTSEFSGICQCKANTLVQTCLPARGTCDECRRTQQTLEDVFDGIEIGISSESFDSVKVFYLICTCVAIGDTSPHTQGGNSPQCALCLSLPFSNSWSP